MPYFYLTDEDGANTLDLVKEGTTWAFGGIYGIPVFFRDLESGQALPGHLRTDDDNLPGSEKDIVVICKLYVWDAANSKWVRMTQP